MGHKQRKDRHAERRGQKPREGEGRCGEGEVGGVGGGTPETQREDRDPEKGGPETEGQEEGTEMDAEMAKLSRQ